MLFSVAETEILRSMPFSVAVWGKLCPLGFGCRQRKKKGKKRKKLVAVLGSSRYKARMKRIRAVLIRVRKLNSLNKRATIRRSHQETRYGKH